jgi:hypothetical protein
MARDENKSIFFIRIKFDANILNLSIELDCIIVSEKARLDFININCKQVIIDSSVSKYKWEQIKKECRKWDIPFYNVNTQGAYLFEINA